MLTRDNATVWLGAWIDACSYWRMFMPQYSMPGSSFYCFANKPDYNLILGNDICVVQRCHTKPQYEFIKLVAGLDMKIVYDIDDNMWELPEYNPAHSLLNQHREGFGACMRMVDVVSVSTKTLAKAVRKHVKFMVNERTKKEIPIMVAENRIDERMFSEPVKNERLVVGWAGSNSHIGDILLVEDALGQLAAEQPEILIQYRGLDVAEGSPLKKVSNFEFKHWTAVSEFGARMPMWGWSVALAPLTECAFNEAKSGIKMLEAAYCGIPCLASWVKPYEELCSRDSELRWLLCASKSSWYTKLKALVNDVAMREHYGSRLKAVMKQYYTLDKEHEGWKAVFEQVRA